MGQPLPALGLHPPSHVLDDLGDARAEELICSICHQHHHRDNNGDFGCLDPYLDELILTLGRLNWRTGPALTIVLGRLLQRAGRKWDRASRFMLLKEQARPYVRFGRAAKIAALFILSVSGASVQVTA